MCARISGHLSVLHAVAYSKCSILFNFGFKCIRSTGRNNLKSILDLKFPYISPNYLHLPG